MANDNDSRVGDVPLGINPRLLSIEEQAQIGHLKDLEQELLLWIDKLAKRKGGGSRNLSIAKTEIQTGIMWALREFTEE